jgi:hypothetical protein
MIKGGDYFMVPSQRESVMVSSSIPFRINNIQKLDKKRQIVIHWFFLF